MSETSFFLSHIESFAELANSPSGTDFQFLWRVEIIEIIFYSSLITRLFLEHTFSYNIILHPLVLKESKSLNKTGFKQRFCFKTSCVYFLWFQK